MEKVKALEIRELEKGDVEGWNDYLKLLNLYAEDRMGLGVSLSEDRLEELRNTLPSIETGRYLIAYVDGEALGFLTAFMGFSTFKCRSLLNVHDIAVVSQLRGKGIGRELLRHAEIIAYRENCCRLSLEVRTDNEGAMSLYRSEGYECGGEGYEMKFMEKALV